MQESKARLLKVVIKYKKIPREKEKSGAKNAYKRVYQDFLEVTVRINIIFYYYYYVLDRIGDLPKTAREKEARTMAHQRNIRSREQKPPRECNDRSSCPVQREEASYTQSGSPLDNSAHHGATTRESAAAARRTRGLCC